MLCHHEALMEMKWNRLLVEESEECILLVCSETCENHNVKILARRVISSVRSVLTDVTTNHLIALSPHYICYIYSHLRSSTSARGR